MPEAFEHPCWRLDSHGDSGIKESQAVLDQLLPMLKGLVKTGYNVYMPFYGSVYYSSILWPTAEDHFTGFAIFDSSVHLVGEAVSFLPFIFWFSLFYSLAPHFPTSASVHSRSPFTQTISLLPRNLQPHLDLVICRRLEENSQFQIVFHLSLEA